MKTSEVAESAARREAVVAWLTNAARQLIAEGKSLGKIPQQVCLSCAQAGPEHFGEYLAACRHRALTSFKVERVEALHRAAPLAAAVNRLRFRVAGLHVLSPGDVHVLLSVGRITTPYLVDAATDDTPAPLYEDPDLLPGEPWEARLERLRGLVEADARERAVRALTWLVDPPDAEAVTTARARAQELLPDLVAKLRGPTG